MEEATRERSTHVVGRESELVELEGFLESSSRHTLLLVGEPGIGKTTLWEAGVEAARERGLRVLAARPSGADAQASFGLDIAPARLARGFRRFVGNPLFALELGRALVAQRAGDR
jgi:MoxR-like ATPase